MLHTYILLYLMEREAIAKLRRGRLLGFPLAPLMHECGVPRATFYRAVNDLLDEGMIIKQKNTYYLLSDFVRCRANLCKNASDVTR